MKIESLHKTFDDRDANVAYELVVHMPAGHGSGHSHYLYLDRDGKVLRIETMLQCRWQAVRQTLVDFWSAKYAKEIAAAFRPEAIK